MCVFFSSVGADAFFLTSIFSDIPYPYAPDVHTEPFPVMAVIEFQVCFVFSFRLTVHDITVEDRHGVVFIYKLWFPTLSVCLFP